MSTELTWQRRILFSVILAGFVLLVIETALQLFYRFTAGDFLFRRTGLPIFEADPTRCYRLRSNLEYRHRTNEFDVVVYTNSQGMRTDARQLDVPLQRAPAAYRILFLGPSFTFGWGNAFEDSYPTILGELLRKEGWNVEIVNLGTPAQTVKPQLCWLREEGYRFRPDLVIQTLYGDSIGIVESECSKPLTCPVIQDAKLHISKPTLMRRVTGTAKNLGFVFYGYYAYQSLLGIRAADGVGTGKEFYGDDTTRGEPRDHLELAAAFQHYEQFVHETLGDHVPVVFLHIPLSFVVHPEDAGRWSHLVNPDPMGSRHRIREAASALRRASLTVIDTTESLVKGAHEVRQYYWLDIHLTPVGNRVVAQAALPVVQQLVRSGQMKKDVR
jgi:lysophospholipase L1-like esterase